MLPAAFAHHLQAGCGHKAPSGWTGPLGAAKIGWHGRGGPFSGEASKPFPWRGFSGTSWDLGLFVLRKILSDPFQSFP